VNWLGKAIAIDLSIGLGLTLFGLVAPEMRKRAEQQAKAALVSASPELAEQLEQLELQAAEVSP
jgi:hypothetical protein